MHIILALQTSPPSAELQPADVDKMVKPMPAFEGLRLEGDNIHRGQGNFKVSRYTSSGKKKGVKFTHICLLTDIILLS
jgi:hypothetical protein